MLPLLKIINGLKIRSIPSTTNNKLTKIYKIPFPDGSYIKANISKIVKGIKNIELKIPIFL